ncbi:MAG: hypothetical protein DRR06_03625 [Gammaproteobacteria bacterium]|nr:MAG: hypothetical protein DRR06_03625 [Gammaproteobacteria bacterium]RLA53718.1 MAG: hypothetical protein DRR42_03985 [Gammaproteobacteria bacterium]
MQIDQVPVSMLSRGYIAGNSIAGDSFWKSPANFWWYAEFKRRRIEASPAALFNVRRKYHYHIPS